MTRARLSAGVLAGLIVAGVVTASVHGRPALSRWVWSQFAGQLEQLFDATLEIDSFEVSVFPTVRAEGRGLRLHKRGQPDSEPILAIDKLSASTTISRLRRGNIRAVRVDGMIITVPSDMRPKLGRAADAGDPAPGRLPPLSIDEIVAGTSRLVIAPNSAAGLPLEFQLEMVRFDAFSTNAPARFEAWLLNPRPRGAIVASGSFGPWQSQDPRRTHVAGDYTLTRADMSVFRGIGGRLDSKGRFDGILERISVEGTTSMRDFSVETGNHPMPLTTSFNARVDGTNGNTYLDRVSARLNESPLEMKGEIAGTPGKKGKTIRLHVRTDAARLEDLITLVVSQQPAAMSGTLGLDASLELPPGDEPVVDTLKLDGSFAIARGRFTSDSVQDKIDELSRRGRGQPGNADIDNVMSQFGGRFTLRRSRLGLPRLSFMVRGAEVRLAGAYGLRGEQLGFTGELRLQARISQTTTGFKSILLKVIDPFFGKFGAGAVLPIRVGGTVDKPEFGLDLFRRRNATSRRPG